jgi:limonene-1,2-epoxide hydrolase
MSTPIEVAVQTYVALVQERDPAVRARMLEACWAEDGRLVTRSGEIRGRAAIAAMLDRFFADPRGFTVELASVIDAQGTTFRFRARTTARDGSPVPDVFDAGMVDADGRISLILTFAGPLADAA